MSKREEYEQILSELNYAQSEDEVILSISKIVKGFTSDYYKNDLNENPYFKSLLPEIKVTIISELKKIKTSLQEEINAIETEIKKLNDIGVFSVNDKDISKLRQLKKDCIILIKELDTRIEDLSHL